ncbi:YbaB/EbfC family nucleoid-associated protein [Gordonia rubripertincta]|uniref:YbaB/EbfC family nucleoid-associated protein n=1 Tax=Gordonia rubripertincta TaxID=36822 RepID=A0ABT4N310_GORRU|nr:YbaB/EbfC family nucleoid-associated protein [Gordonia rubripertincta]MCZ4553449.1 YbaB/EbfC family nucleoid-associated protein [Gordonia rubripertincta]
MSWAMDELEARARRQLDGLHEVNERLAAISTRETSPGDHVTAEVDGVGTLTGLWFAPSALTLGAGALGELIVATAGVAAGRAFARRAAILEDFNTSFAELVESRPASLTSTPSTRGTGSAS